MKNRQGLPEFLHSKNFYLPGGGLQAYRDARMLALAWRAVSKKKPVFMFSQTCNSKNKEK